MDWFKDPYELRGKVKWFKEENEAGTYNFPYNIGCYRGTL
jgi:hypothetical protein